MTGIRAIVHVNSDQWKQTPRAQRVYIGRRMTGYPPSIWGNPYRITPGGYTRAESIEQYEQHLRANPHLLPRLAELDDKVLGCWCAPRACHGEVLQRLRAEQLAQPPRRTFTLITNDPEQRAWWLSVFGTDALPIRDPQPHTAIIPHYDTPQLVYLLDFPALPLDVQERAVRVMASYWGLDEDELWDEIARSGFPLRQTDWCVVEELWHVDAPDAA